MPNNDTVGPIRINLKGRDYNGLVEPGAEYDRICDDLSAALAELTDPISGRPVAMRISRIQRELHGPRLDRLPDITVHWEQSFPWSALCSPRFGIVELRNQDARTGSHAYPRLHAGVGRRHSARSDNFRRVDFRSCPDNLIRCWYACADRLRRPTLVFRIVHARMIASTPA